MERDTGKTKTENKENRVNRTKRKEEEEKKSYFQIRFLLSSPKIYLSPFLLHPIHQHSSYQAIYIRLRNKR